MRKKREVNLGQTLETEDYGLVEVIEVLPNDRYRVSFKNTGYEKTISREKLLKGSVTDHIAKKDHVIGSIFTTKNCGDVEIISYLGSSRFMIKFLDTGHTVETTKGDLRKGSIKDRYRPLICGVGFIGEGPYTQRKDSKATSIWRHMLRRCYSDKEGFKNYFDCSVCEEWHNFQNFAAWCYTQKGFNNEGWELDKDLLVVGNREYRPNNCCFVPQRLNLLFKVHLPIGRPMKNGKFEFTYRTVEGDTRSKRFSDRDEGTAWWVKTKDKLVHDLAEIYKDLLDEHAYNAIIRWNLLDRAEQIQCQGSTYSLHG